MSPIRQIVLLLSFLLASHAAAQPRKNYKLSFGSDSPLDADRTIVAAATPYNQSRGYGFESGTGPAETRPFFFSLALPEGNYKVTVTLGDPAAQSTTTVKAELRRLMLENVTVPAGKSEARSFIVNVRRAEYPGGKVKLKSPRETTDEAWAWDEKLTLEFNGTHPALMRLDVEPARVPTVFILGDSTVCDQSKEPYASWGQMLPRFFKPEVAVANHAESGETLGSSTAAHRFDKVMSLMRPGDYLLIQYGHNDMKSKDPNAAEIYKATLKKWVGEVKGKGGTPILITPVNRHSFQGATVTNSLREYPDKVCEAAKEEGVALIDLNAMSKTLYEALGPDPSIQLFEHTEDLKKFDGTHHSPYGAYELAKCVLLGLRGTALRTAIAEDVTPFDPAKPEPVSAFSVPPTPGMRGGRPLGD